MKRYVRANDGKLVFTPNTPTKHKLFYLWYSPQSCTAAFKYNIVADSLEEAKSMFETYMATLGDGLRDNGGARYFYEDAKHDCINKPAWHDEGETTKDKGIYELPKKNMWHGSDHLWD